MCKKFGSGHTMCLPKRGPACKEEDKTGITLSKAEQNEMVKLHNDVRRKVANGTFHGVKVANIRKISWDDDLAKVAQRWSDQVIII